METQQILQKPLSTLVLGPNDDEDLLKQIFELRINAWLREPHVEKGDDRDKYDAHSVHITLVTGDNEVAAAIRLTSNAIGLPALDLFKDQLFKDCFTKRGSYQLSKICVNPAVAEIIPDIKLIRELNLAVQAYINLHEEISRVYAIIPESFVFLLRRLFFSLSVMPQLSIKQGAVTFLPVEIKSPTNEDIAIAM